MLLVTWNVNGLRARFSEVSELARTLAPDLLCLQEIKASPAQVPEPLTGLPAYHSHYHGAQGGYSGVSVHVRRQPGRSRPAIEVPSFDFETRVAVATVSSDLRVASVYVPNGNKDYEAKRRFLRDMTAWAQGQSDLVIAGDLNVALTDADVHERMRKAGAIGQRTEEREHLESLLSSGHRDVLRDANEGRDDVFTWWPPWREEKANNRGWRIDFVLMPEALAETVTSVRVLSEFGSSDHAPVAVEFGL